MADEKTVPTLEDLEAVEKRFSEVSEVMWKRWSEARAELEKKDEELEQQVAMLAMAFAESAVLIEALTGQLNFATQEEKEAFFNTMKQSREHMLEVMSTHGNVDTKDRGSSATVESVDEKDYPPSASQ